MDYEDRRPVEVPRTVRGLGVAEAGNIEIQKPGLVDGPIHAQINASISRLHSVPSLLEDLQRTMGDEKSDAPDGPKIVYQAESYIEAMRAAPGRIDAIIETCETLIEDLRRRIFRCE